MNLIQLIACIGLITGCFVLLHISPMDFTEGVFRRITSKPKSIRSEVNESTRRKKKSFLRREIEETQTILRMTGRAAKFPMVCALSLLLFLVGAAFALTLGNLFLVPVLAVGLCYEVESDVLKLLVYYILSLMSVNGPADSVLRAAFCHYPENYITLMEYYDPAEHGMEAYTRK